MAVKILENVLYYGVEGLATLYCSWTLVTRFFGFPAKKRTGRKYVMAGILLLFVIMGCIGSMVLRPALGETDGEIVPVSGLMSLMMIFFLPFQLLEKKGKGFLVAFFSDELLTVSLLLLMALARGIGELAGIGKEGLLIVNAGGYLIIMALVWCIGTLSGKRRKEPMSLQTMLFVFLSAVLTDIALGFINPFQYADDTQAMFRIRIVYTGRESAIWNILILAFAFLLLGVFMVLAVRESEAKYFQKKILIGEYYLETQKDHYEQQIEANQEIRRIRHDVKNHAYVMKELLRRKEYGELEEYLSEVTREMEQADVSVHVGNEIADAILSEKKQKAERLGIEMKVEGEMTGVSLSAVDTCTILANMLDNAIEAVAGLMAKDGQNVTEGRAATEGKDGADREAQACGKPVIELSFRKNQNFLLIEERNPARENIVVENGLIATTKKDRGNHGFGLPGIREAAGKYDGECVITAKDGHFTLEIMLPLTEKIPAQEGKKIG